MRSRQVPQAGDDPSSTIRDTLRSDVVDIYREIVPPLGRMSSERAYERIIESPEILDGCFQIFNRKRHLFRKLLVGPDGTPVEDDDQPLRCGRSLREVTAMVVRTSARRYFHQVLRDPPRKPPPPPKLGLWARLMIALGLREPPKPPRQPLPRAERQYAAVKDSLLHAWQVPLIPQYAQMSDIVLRRLGPGILDYKDRSTLGALGAPDLMTEAGPAPGSGALAQPVANAMAEVHAVMKGEPLPAAAPGATVHALGAGQVAPGGEREESLWRMAQNADFTKLMAMRDHGEMRRLVAVAAAAGTDTVAMLNKDLRLPMLHQGALLCALARTFGPARFVALFGPPEAPALVHRLRDLVSSQHLADARRGPEVVEKACELAMLLAIDPLSQTENVAA